MEVFPVDQQDIDGFPLERLGCEESAESRSNDDDTRSLVHIFPLIFCLDVIVTTHSIAYCEKLRNNLFLFSQDTLPFSAYPNSRMLRKNQNNHLKAHSIGLRYTRNDLQGGEMRFSHEEFLSPFTWRYGSPAMRAIWSEVNK